VDLSRLATGGAPSRPPSSRPSSDRDRSDDAAEPDLCDSASTGPHNVLTLTSAPLLERFWHYLLCAGPVSIKEVVVAHPTTTHQHRGMGLNGSNDEESVILHAIEWRRGSYWNSRFGPQPPAGSPGCASGAPRNEPRPHRPLNEIRNAGVHNTVA
jgi:hypothetical protein